MLCFADRFDFHAFSHTVSARGADPRRPLAAPLHDRTARPAPRASQPDAGFMRRVCAERLETACGRAAHASAAQASARAKLSLATLLSALTLALLVLVGAGGRAAQALPAPGPVAPASAALERAGAAPAADTLGLLRRAAYSGSFDEAFTKVFYGTWAVGGRNNCGVPRKTYTVEVSSGQIIWRDGTGSIDVENIRDAHFGGPYGLLSVETVTLASHHDGGRRENSGKVWSYEIVTANQMAVSTSSMRFILVRCW